MRAVADQIREMDAAGREKFTNLMGSQRQMAGVNEADHLDPEHRGFSRLAMSKYVWAQFLGRPHNIQVAWVRHIPR